MLRRSVNISLSIELGSDPIAGVMTADSDQEPRSFNGWVELASVIEDVRVRRPGGAGAESLGLVPGASSRGRD
jgi:hypothetical protein